LSDTDDKDNPLGLHFEHEWQREAWDVEMAERKERRRKQRQDETEAAGGKIIDLLERVNPTLVEDEPRRCPAGHMPMPAGSPDEHCDRIAHYRWHAEWNCAVSVGRCPELRKRETAELYERERKRLAGELTQISRLGRVGFDGYDVTRGPGAGEAWKAAKEFSEGRPPKRNVLFAGTTGLGKTRLLLASHFALLKAGVRSVYVTSPELRAAFDDQRAYDEELREQGNAVVERLVRTQAVHLDDLGNVDDDERKRGQFAEGLKKVLDRSAAAWFAATNLTWDEATRHPDVGAKVLSRLVSGAVVVRLDGKDFRIAQAERR
jgi:DNA replication protein DnaC